MKRILFILFAFLLSSVSFAQEIKIQGNKFTQNGQEIWFNGINTPWHLFGDFGRQDFDAQWWTDEFAKYKENHINLARVWIHMSGEFGPNIDSNGTITGTDDLFWEHMDHLMDVSEQNEVYLMPALFSFDITKNGYKTTAEWRNWIQSEANVQSYIDKVLIPMLKRYEDRSYILAWEICNEPEWMFENQEHGPQSFDDVQRMHAMLAAAVHENSSKYVTTGSAAPKWNAPIYDDWGEKEGNMFSDEALSSIIDNPNAFLDFYQFHWYAWQSQWMSSPFTMTTAEYGVDDRPVIVGESEGNDVCDQYVCQTVSEMYESALSNGFDGVCAWKTPQNDGHGTFENIAAATNNFYQNHPELIYPDGNETTPTDPIAVTGIDLSENTTQLQVGESKLLVAQITPSDASNKEITWLSSNNEIAQVSAQGNVSAVAVGTATIFATSVDGNYQDSCILNIIAPTTEQYFLTVKAIENGSVSVSPEAEFYEEGTSVTITANPIDGYRFVEWTGDLVSNENPASIVMNSDKMIEATFTEDMSSGGDETYVSIPFRFDGEGEYSWVVTGQIDYINSWCLENLTINDVLITNKYVATQALPDPINGSYQIKYTGKYAWSHVEIIGTQTEAINEMSNLVASNGDAQAGSEETDNATRTTVQSTSGKNYLTANGNQLFDASGKEVFLRGVNWFGFETKMGYFHGIWARDHKSMLQQIKDLGFNCIRIPWNNDILTQDISAEINTYGTDPYTGVSPMNEEESTKTKSLEILDITIKWCQENNLKVILDNHSREPDGYMVEALWYTEKVSHEQWIKDWMFMAERYKDYDAVVAMDINNEPHGSYGAGSRWGTGNPDNDWRIAAQECGNAILSVNPELLIMVEGTEEFGETSYWWGGNLQGAKEYPVELSNPNKLVYSPHEYGPTVFNQDWFQTADFPENLPGIWETNFNYLHTNGTSPLFFGEFGIRDAGGKDEIWFDKLISYMAEKGHHWTFWCWNPNSGDTGGLLDNQWANVEEWKMEKLRPYLADEIPNGSVEVVKPIAVSSVTLEPEQTTLTIGQELALSVTVLPENASDKTVSYHSNNPAVTNVNANGIISAVAEGSTEIIVTTNDGGFTAVMTVNVINPTANEYVLDVVVGGSGDGTIQVSPLQSSYTEGTSVTLTAIAEEGYEFSTWSGDAIGNDPELLVIMDQDKEITALFVEKDQGTGEYTTIALDYKQDGAGELKWETTDEISYINSWCVDKLEINGVDITNIYMSEMPAKIDGKYYIVYQASKGWSHVEIMGSSNKGLSITTSNEDILETEQYLIAPNPAGETVTIYGVENAQRIIIMTMSGKKIYETELNEQPSIELQVDSYKPGIYFVAIQKSNGQMITKKLIKK